MASNCCSPMKYMDICKTAFYFTEVGTDLDEDSFDKSTITIERCLIGSSKNKFLVVKEKQFEAKNLTSAEQEQPECKFNIQFYRDSKTEEQKGRAVILYADKDGKKMMVSCKDGREIYAEEMERIPDHIPSEEHRAVFYRRELEISDKYLFQSSLHRNKFLAFEPYEKDQTLSKLVLHEKPEDAVDVCSEVSVIRSN